MDFLFCNLEFESWFSGYLAYEDEDEDDKDEEQDCVYWTVSGTNATWAIISKSGICPNNSHHMHPLVRKNP